MQRKIPNQSLRRNLLRQNPTPNRHRRRRLKRLRRNRSLRKSRRLRPPTNPSPPQRQENLRRNPPLRQTLLLLRASKKVRRLKRPLQKQTSRTHPLQKRRVSPLKPNNQSRRQGISPLKSRPLQSPRQRRVKRRQKRALSLLRTLRRKT